MTRWWTGRGDNGSTDFRSRRIGKDSKEIHVLGALDEASSALGLVRSNVPELDMVLVPVQRDLYRLMGNYASRQTLPMAEAADWVERIAEKYNAELPELREFVLPGTSPQSALLDWARVVVRRAERECVAMIQDNDILRYMNRLSSLLFVLARWVEHQSGTAPRLAKEVYS